MHRKRYKNHTMVLLLLILLIAGTMAVAPATALKVEGARIALDIEPGKTVTAPIGISIKTDEAEGDFAIEALGFGQSVADGTYTALEAAADTSPLSARSFITIDKPTVHLKPGERTDVTATIRVPADSRDGGRYAIILVHPAATAGGKQTAFATAVAIPVLLTIKGGTISEKGEITAVENTIIQPGKPFIVTTTAKNTGNYHYYSVISNVTITDAQGKSVATVKTDPFSRAIVPGQQVQIIASVPQGLPEASYQLTSRIEKQDGMLLDTETKTIQIGKPASGSTVSPGVSSDVGAVRTTYAPGPGGLAVCIAAALGLLGGVWTTRKGQR